MSEDGAPSNATLASPSSEQAPFGGSSSMSRRSFDRSKSPIERPRTRSPDDRSQQATLGSANPMNMERRATSPQGISTFSFPSTSSASSTPVGTPTLPSASLPSHHTGRSASISGASPSDPFNFAGSPSLSNRPLEAAKHQHHRSRSINMGGFSPVMKGGKLINFGSGPVSISGPSGDGGSSDGSSSSSSNSPLSSSPASGQGLAAGFDPNSLGPSISFSLSQGQTSSTAPRAPSPLQQSHLASPLHQMDTDAPTSPVKSASSTSPLASPAMSAISHNHRDSRTIDFNAASRGWESPQIAPTSLPLPIPIGQHSLSSLRAAAAASERARSPKPLSLGEPEVSPNFGHDRSSAAQSEAAEALSKATSSSSASARRSSDARGSEPTSSSSPAHAHVPSTVSAPTTASTTHASTSAAIPVISRPISPRGAWPGVNGGLSPASTASTSAFPLSSSPGARLGRPISPALRSTATSDLGLLRGRTPSPSRAAAGSAISRGNSMSPPLDAEGHLMRLRPASPGNWDSSWPNVASSSRALPIGLSSSPHGRVGGVRLERNFSSGSGSSSGSPGTSPGTSSSNGFAYAAAPNGLGLGSTASWRFPSSPRSGGNKILSPPSRPGRSFASRPSRSRSPSPSTDVPFATSDSAKRAAGSDGEDAGGDRNASIHQSVEDGHASTSPRALFIPRNRSSSSSSSSSQGSDGGGDVPPSAQRSAQRFSHGRAVSFDRAQNASPRDGPERPSETGKHGRKVSDPMPTLLKSPPAMRIAHGSAKAEVDARQALSENTKSKAGAAGGLIADEVDAFSDQLPPPTIPPASASDSLTPSRVDDTDPLSRPATSSSHSSSHVPALGGASASLSQLVRPTPVDGRLLPAFASSNMTRSGSGGPASHALGFGGSDIPPIGLQSPKGPLSMAMPASPRMGPSPLPASERTLFGLRSRSPSPAAMLSPTPFDPLRRQSSSPSPLVHPADALSGESPPKTRSFIGMPPRSGYDLSDDPDDVGSEGDGSSVSSAEGREGSIGGGDEDSMDEKEDDESESRLRAKYSHEEEDDEEQDITERPTGSRRALRGLPSDISRSTLFTRRQNASHSSSDGDVEDNKEGNDEGAAVGNDVQDERSDTPWVRDTPLDIGVDSPSRPTVPRKPSLTRSNAVPPAPETEDADAPNDTSMPSVLGFFHGDEPESQLDELSDWGAPLSRQAGNAARNSLLASSDADGDTSVSNDADWAPPSSQGTGIVPEEPAADSEEALTTLERIFLFAKSEATFHRVLVSQCLAEWILDVKLNDAVEYIIPLLNGLSTDEAEVCEAFSPELHRIMWFFFRNCPLKQPDSTNHDQAADSTTQVNGDAEETAIRPHLDIGIFTPLLCALLLNQNTGIARSTQNAIVQFCSRLHRDSDGLLLSEDGSWTPELEERCNNDHTFLIASTLNRDGKEIAYESYHFGPAARQMVEQEILQNVAIAIGSLNAHQASDGRKGSMDTNAHEADKSREEEPETKSPIPSAEPSSSQNGLSSESGELSRDEASWDPESQMDSQMEDAWPSDGGLFDASSPQLAPFSRGEFDEEAAVARMAGVSMLAALAAEGILHIDIVTNKFVPEMVGLQHDPAFFVRKEVAVSLGVLAKAVASEDVVKNSLLPTLDAHLHDKIWHVRQAACLSLPAVLSKTDAETQRNRAVTYLRLLVNDVSRNVRSAALEIIGELVFLFYEKADGVPEELIRFFLGEPLDDADEDMLGVGQNQDGASTSRLELSNVTSEYGYIDGLHPTAGSAWGGGMSAQIDVHERAVVTAFNFPAVVYTMGAKHWTRLQALHEQLSRDYATKVRRSLASSLHEIAKIIGPESTRADLLPIFDRFLQDSESEIKSAVVENIDVFLAQLPQEHALAELRTMQERWLHAFGRDWRLRERLAQHVSSMADTFLLSDEDANLIAIMQLAITDPVSAVRDAGILSIAKIYNIFSEHDQAAADGFLALVDDFGNSSSYRIRVASLMAIEALIQGSLQRAALETILLERLIAAADDDVIDVRIVLARCVAAMCQKDELYGLPQSRGPEVQGLIAKLARDVSAEVRTPVHVLLSEAEVEAAEKDAQENMSHAPKASTRTLVLGPKDGGPHREPKTSSVSTGPNMGMMDVSSEGDEEEMQAFAMDEDVSEHQQQQQQQLRLRHHQEMEDGSLALTQITIPAPEPEDDS